jgi:ribosomal protein S18 acetylase RimI-like enzyme
MQESLTLRPIGADDEKFLFGLFRAVHEPVFESLNLSDDQKIALLRMQFSAQQQQYRHQYPAADFDIVLRDDLATGSIYALRGPDEFVLIDIALLPEFRNAGVGSKLVTTLIRQAKEKRKSVSAHVRKDNPAWRLWQRLGFQAEHDDGIYLRIRVPYADGNR